MYYLYSVWTLYTVCVLEYENSICIVSISRSSGAGLPRVQLIDTKLEVED